MGLPGLGPLQAALKTSACRGEAFSCSLCIWPRPSLPGKEEEEDPPMQKTPPHPLPRGHQQGSHNAFPRRSLPPRGPVTTSHQECDSLS